MWQLEVKKCNEAVIGGPDCTLPGAECELPTPQQRTVVGMSQMQVIIPAAESVLAGTLTSEILVNLVNLVSLVGHGP